MKNNLVCWEENQIKKWEMVKDEDSTTFYMNLLTNQNVKKHSIFVIPTNAFAAGIWLVAKMHKSQRVDFFNFYEDYGQVYVKPETTPDNKKVIDEINDKHGDDTKYGWLSPDGRYYHCEWQGHSALADKICFGHTDTQNAEHYLEETGWCKIYKSPACNNYRVYIGGKHTITKEQMNTLVKMKLDNAEDLNEMLCKN